MDLFRQLVDNIDISLVCGIPALVALAICLGIGILVYAVSSTSNKQEKPLPDNKRIGGTISEILIFPVKSVGPLYLQECEIDEFGFKDDRVYMLAKRDIMTDHELKAKKKERYLNQKNLHEFITQREEPKMTLVRPTIDKPKNQLSLRYDSGEGPGTSSSSVLVLPLDISKKAYVNGDGNNVIINKDVLPTMRVVIWGEFPDAYDVESLATLYDETGKAVDTPTPVSTFFSDIVGTKHASTLVCSRTRRVVEERRSVPSAAEINRVPQTSFQDYFPGHFITDSSMAALAEKVTERTGEDLMLSSLHFRPNLVLTGTVAPWDEDDWKHISFQSGTDSSIIHDWYVICRNVRCQIPNVSLEKGIFHPKSEPYKTMQSFRRIDKGAPFGPCFGMNIVQKSHGYSLSVGDKVVVNKRGEHLYVGI